MIRCLQIPHPESLVRHPERSEGSQMVLNSGDLSRETYALRMTCLGGAHDQNNS